MTKILFGAVFLRLLLTVLDDATKAWYGSDGMRVWRAFFNVVALIVLCIIVLPLLVP